MDSLTTAPRRELLENEVLNEVLSVEGARFLKDRLRLEDGKVVKSQYLMERDESLQSDKIWVQILTLPFTNFVTLSKLCECS